MSTYNITPLLCRTRGDDDYLGELTISKRDDDALKDARRQVREALRANLPKLIRKELPNIRSIQQPRFVTQGSYAYKTINSPCHVGQQIDMDDGCYLPMSFAEEFQVGHASNIFFAAIEHILKPLAEKNKWEMKEKDTCVRLELSDTKHIDIPLYAIPDHDFQTIQESMKLSMERRYGVQDSFDLSPTDWDDLPQGKVLLAVRGGKWKPSDPRPIIKWAKLQAKVKGEQWLRVVRYIKGWRDFHWPTVGPTSICLMAAVDQVFLASRPDGRDDIALMDVMAKLPNIFAGPIMNPAEPDLNEDLSKRLDEKGIREEVQGKLRRTHEALHASISGKMTKEAACEMLQAHFGDRVPFAPERIQIATSIAATVKNTPARQNVERPSIRSTKSG